MKTQLLAAGRKGPVDPFWPFVVLQTKISKGSNPTLTNVIGGAPFTLGAGASIDTDTEFKLSDQGGALRLNGASNAFASLPYDANIMFGTGDFTIEWFWKVDAVVTQPADGSKLVPLIFWSGPATSGQPLNFEVVQNEGAGTMAMASVAQGNAGGVVQRPTAVSSKTVREHWAITRKNGVLSMYRNGTRQGTSIAYTANVRADLNQPLILGRRIGGNGTVYWNLNGVLAGLRITKAARYDGAEIVVPAKFQTY